MYLRPEDAFERRVNLGEQPADPVGQPGRFAGEVVVEPDQDFQLCQRFVADIDPAQRVGHGAGRVGDHIGVAGIGLRLPGCRSAIRRIASPGR